MRVKCIVPKPRGFPGSSAVTEFACNAEDLGLIPGLGRSPGGAHGSQLLLITQPGHELPAANSSAPAPRSSQRLSRSVSRCQSFATDATFIYTITD